MLEVLFSFVAFLSLAFTRRIISVASLADDPFPFSQCYINYTFIDQRKTRARSNWSELVNLKIIILWLPAKHLAPLPTIDTVDARLLIYLGQKKE